MAIRDWTQGKYGCSKQCKLPPAQLISLLLQYYTIFDIDIKKAECSINEIRGYLDANKDVLVLCLANHIDFQFHMPEYLYREENGLGYPPYVEKDEGEYRYLIQETKCGYSYSIVTLRKNG